MASAIIAEVKLKITSHSGKIASNIKYWIKQLLPLTYFSDYEIKITGAVRDTSRQVCVWKMWLGHCYNINTWEVLKKVEHMTDKEIAK